MSTTNKAAWIGFGGILAGALLTGLFMVWTRSDSQHTKVESQSQSGGLTAETVGDTYHVGSENQSGGITAGRVDIKVNPEKPKLVLAKDKTKTQVADGVYEKKFYFRNPEGLALQKVVLKVTFDNEFISGKGDKWVWTGMIVRGSERTQLGSARKSMVFSTAVLEPIAFIEVTVKSKHDIQIKDFKFKTQ